MRRLAAILAGLIAFGGMLIAQPWGRLGCDPTLCSMSTDYGGAWMLVGGLTLYLVLPAMLVSSVLVGVLSLAESSRPRDAAILAALGRSQADETRVATRTGLRHGLVAVGTAWALAAAIHLAVLAASGWPLTTEPQLWIIRSVEAIMAIGALVVAHVIDATRPRRSPVERLHEHVAPPQRRRLGLRVRAIVLGGIAAVAAGIMLGLALGWHEPVPWREFVVLNTAGVATIITAIALTLLSFAVLMPAARERSAAAVRAAARVARLLGRGRAAAVLEARSHGPSIAATGAMGVIAAAGFLVAVATSVEPAPPVAETFVGVVDTSPPGEVPAVADGLAQVDGIALVVPVSTVNGIDSGYPTLLAVEPSVLEPADPVLAARLRDEPTVVVSDAGPWTTSVESFGEVGATGIRQARTGGWAFVNAAQAPELTRPALLLYAEPGADLAEVAARVEAYDFAQYDRAISWGIGFAPGAAENASDWVGVAVLVVAALVLVVIPAAALAVGTVARRRRDDATMAALGATAATVRAANAVEAAVIAGVAAFAGLASGAFTHAAVALVDRWRFSLTGVITDHEVGWALGTVAWGVLALAFAVIVAVVGVTAWVAAAVQARRTPVANLSSTETGALA